MLGLGELRDLLRRVPEREQRFRPGNMIGSKNR
jgi:hypothetical protein